MTKFALKLGAAAALAFCTLIGAAQAGGSLDDDGYGYQHRGPSYAYGKVCGPTVRAAGKRNLFPGFARNSALFAWQREVRAVHGPAYSNWGYARRAHFSGGPAGGLIGCGATAGPCRT